MLKMEHHCNKKMVKECVLKISTEPMIIPIQLQPEKKRSRSTVSNVCIPHRRQVAVAATSENRSPWTTPQSSKDLIYNNNGPFQGQLFIHESISFKLSFAINVKTVLCSFFLQQLRGLFGKFWDNMIFSVSNYSCV